MLKSFQRIFGKVCNVSPSSFSDCHINVYEPQPMLEIFAVFPQDILSDCEHLTLSVSGVKYANNAEVFSRPPTGGFFRAGSSKSRGCGGM